MAKDVSIAFKASDNLTNSLQKMRKSVDGLSRDVSEYRRIQDKAFGEKAKVEIDISKAKSALKELDKAIKNNVEGAEEAFAEKKKSLEQLNEEYKRLTRVANEASKAELKLQDDLHKTKNQKNTMAAQQSSLLKSITSAGLGNMLGDALTSSISLDISSTFGLEAGNAINDILGGIASGAALGSIAGPVGSALGAAVGGISGSITAETEKQQRDDDRLREEVKSLHSKVLQDQADSLQNGLSLASERELLVRGLGTLLESQEKGNKLFEDIKQFGIDTPYDGISMLRSAEQMLAYGMAEDTLMENIKMLGDVANGDQNKFNSLSYAYAQTQSAGKLTGQDWLQYTAAGFNPLSILAEEQGKTLEEMQEMMSKGLISAQDVTRAFEIATSEGGRFFNAAKNQMETYSGQVSMLKDLWNEVDASMGDGYMRKRKDGLELEIEQLSGKLGDKMKEANSLIGEFEASLENKYQQSIINAMSSTMETDAYKMAKREDDKLEMARLVWKARTQAEIDYKNSEEMKLKYEAERGLVQDIQQALIDDHTYLDYGKAMGEQFSLGYSGVVRDIISRGILTEPEEDKLVQDSGSVWQKTWWGIKGAFSDAKENGIPTFNTVGYGYATGLDRVPRDNMLVRVHEGERILTKLDADKQDKGGISAPVINVSNMTVREEADIHRIADELYGLMQKAAINMGRA